MEEFKCTTNWDKSTRFVCIAFPKSNVLCGCALEQEQINNESWYKIPLPLVRWYQRVKRSISPMKQLNICFSVVVFNLNSLFLQFYSLDNVNKNPNLKLMFH